MWVLYVLFAGNFGSAIGALFIFIRWVIFLNFFLTILWISLVVMPTAIYYPYDQMTHHFTIKNFFNGQVSDECSVLNHIPACFHFRSLHTGLVCVMTLIGSVIKWYC